MGFFLLFLIPISAIYFLIIGSMMDLDDGIIILFSLPLLVMIFVAPTALQSSMDEGYKKGQVQCIKGNVEYEQSIRTDTSYVKAAD